MCRVLTGLPCLSNGMTAVATAKAVTQTKWSMWHSMNALSLLVLSHRKTVSCTQQSLLSFLLELSRRKTLL